MIGTKGVDGGTDRHIPAMALRRRDMMLRHD
jgi:hypothetical protein